MHTIPGGNARQRSDDSAAENGSQPTPSGKRGQRTFNATDSSGPPAANSANLDAESSRNPNRSSNGRGKGRSPSAPDNEELNVGKILFVTVPVGLADEMRRVVFAAAEQTLPNEKLKRAVERRSVIVAHQGPGELASVEQLVSYIQGNCHAERIGTLDFHEMGFDGPAESFVGWWDEATGTGHYEDGADFLRVAESRTKWKRFSVESIDDHEGEEELGNPVPDVPEEAFYGPLGRLTLVTQKETEANALFVLLHLMAFTGSAMGRWPYMKIGADRIHTNLGVGIIASSGQRKGSAGNVAKAIFRRIDKEFHDNNIIGGLNSGRGVLENVRDPQTFLNKKTGKEIVDPGVRDKRRVFLETEFAGPFIKAKAESNDLMVILRQALDGVDKIQTLTRESGSATGAHLSIIGHCTPSDLRTHLTANDKANGTAGRFMWHFGARSKRLPRGGDIDELLDTGALDDQLNKVRSAIEFAEKAGKMKWAQAPGERFQGLYCDIDDNRPPGAIGDLFVRAPNFIMRVAMIFALTDCSREIDHPHLDAALSIWNHQAQTLRYLFPADIDHNAERLLAALRSAPKGLTRSQITHDVFKGNMPKVTLDSLLQDLQANRAVTAKQAPSEGRGRRAVVYFATPWETSGTTKKT